eukprot:4792835-Prymnesium_polylepis.1
MRSQGSALSARGESMRFGTQRLNFPSARVPLDGAGEWGGAHSASGAARYLRHDQAVLLQPLD